MNSDRIYYSHDAETHAARAMTRLMALCLMVGLAIGAVLALLFAPASGKATRQDLAKSVEGRLRTGRGTVEPLVKSIEKEFGELQENVEEHLK